MYTRRCKQKDPQVNINLQAYLVTEVTAEAIPVRYSLKFGRDVFVAPKYAKNWPFPPQLAP